MSKTLVTTITAMVGLASVPPVAAEPPPAARGQGWGAASSPVMRPELAERYWTKGKQAKAKTADLPTSLSRRERAQPRTVTGPQPGRPRILTGPEAAQRRTTTAPEARRSTTIPEDRRRSTVPEAKRLTPKGDGNGYAGVPRPYTSATQSRVTGRLFFVNSGGRGDSCSASVVRSASELLIATAAHCVYSVPEGSAQGRWHTHFAFVPAYDGRAGSERQREPYGRWGGRRAWKPDAYTGTTGGDWNSIYDVALIEVGKKSRTLQDTVGALTPMRNQGGRFTIATRGYPGVLGRRPYDGRDQLWCLGRTQPAQVQAAVDMTAARFADEEADGAGRMETYNCHLAKGHSGGPWIVRGTDDLVGVLSAGKDDGEPNGNSVANALNIEGYGAIVRKADPHGVYDSLSVKGSGPAAPVKRGTSTAVTATVTMHGLMAAAKVPITITLPTGASLGAVTGAACTREGGKATCTIPAVHPGRPVRITARVNIGRGASPALPIAMRVTSSRLDPVQRDNTGTVELLVNR